MEDVFICIGLSEDFGDLIWFEPELSNPLLFLSFYCLTVRLHVHDFGRTPKQGPTTLLPEGGGGGVLPYLNFIGMCRPIGAGFFAPFWTENGPTFCPFWFGIGMVFEGTTGVFKRIYREKWVSSKKEGIWIWKGFEEFFCLRPAK